MLHNLHNSNGHMPYGVDICWNKFIENTIVQHQKEVLTVILILNGEKALGGIVDLVILETVPGQQSVLLFPVGIEIHPPVKIYFQLVPDLEQVLLPCFFQHPVEKD